MSPLDPIKPTPEELRVLIDSAPKTPDERYEKAVSDLNLTEDKYSRWCALGSAAKSSLEVGQIDEALSYAEELTDLIPSYQDDWNYGNAIQDSNIVFGIKALLSGDAILAQEFLLAAGRSPGSPQMNSFGPNMTLAKALVEAGHRDGVLTYLDLCRVFWSHHRGLLDHWHLQISEGGYPDFNANLIY